MENQENPSIPENLEPIDPEFSVTPPDNKDEVDPEFGTLSPKELEGFLHYYNEFIDAFNDTHAVGRFLAIYDKVQCLYPEFKDLDSCRNKAPFYSLVAHYVVMAGLGKSVGILANTGLMASSSIGDVSVSYQASPYSTGGDEMTYYLSLTPYGMEYLAWAARQSGLKIVN